MNGLNKTLLQTALLAVTLCALPALAGPDTYGLGTGKDGVPTISAANTLINVYAPLTASASAGATSITVGAATPASPVVPNKPFATGDLVLIMQMGMATTPASGGAASVDITNDAVAGSVGRYELARVTSMSGSTWGLDVPLVNSYAANVTQVIRVPEFTTVSIANATRGLTALAWNGSVGGVVAFLASGAMMDFGTIDVRKLGYRGGAAVADPNGTMGCTNPDEPAPAGAQKGEGAGVTASGATGTGRGRLLNAGGGGVCSLSGGGGGGHGGAGGQGGNTDKTELPSGNRPVGGEGGAQLAYPMTERLLMGGGGGAGHSTDVAGGNGGGIIFIRAASLSGTGNFFANGTSANSATNAASGGGAGGSVYLRFAGTAICGTIQVNGGVGGNGGSSDVGPGGGGGGGRVFLQDSSPGSCGASNIQVTGASPGTQLDSTIPDKSYGATAGANGNSTVLTTAFPATMPVPVVTTPANGSTTNNNKPVLSGTLAATGPAGTQVTIYVDGVAVATVTPTGTAWTFTPTVALADGSHTVNAVAVSTANAVQSTKSNTNTFTVDATPPAAPVVLTPANGSSTNNTKPVYTGTAEANSTVKVYVDGVAVGTTIATASGIWSFTQPTVLPEGPHDVKATATDAVGNVSGFSNTNTFTVDTTPPAAPVVNTPPDGSRTNNPLPLYSGTAEAGTTVTVYVDGVAVGVTTASATGTWSLVQPTALPDGAHTVNATATDAASNVSPTSNTNNFVVDTVPPLPPLVLTPTDGSVINTNTPDYTGNAQGGAVTVTVYVDGTPVGVTSVIGGSWTFTQPFPLADGVHTVWVYSTDGAGNVSPISNTNTFTVDTMPPAPPAVFTPANGSRTNNPKPAYTGIAEANSTVTVYVDNAAMGNTMADGSGNWSFTQPTPLAEGSHSVKATAIDTVGNVSGFSNTNTFTVDTTPPAAPVVSTPANGSRTNNTKPVYTGTAEANSSVTVYVDNVLVGTTMADASGNWSFTQPTALSEGSHSVKATAKDAAGNVSAFSNTNTFTVDTTPPAAPVVVAPANGSTTSNTTPAYTGTAEANSTVTVYVDNVAVGNTTADGSGNWSFTQPTALLEGSHSVKATATDVAGNISVFSNTNTFTVDLTPPSAPVVLTPANGSTSNNTTPAYTGTAEAGSTVTVYVDNVAVGTTTANASGAWSFTQPTALSEGSHSVKATAKDAAGNVSVFSNTNTFTVDTTPPAAPVVVAPANGSHTNNTTPSYTGTAEANSTVTVYVDNVAVGTTTANASGAWSFTQPTALSEGSHAVKATAKDAAGNVSVFSNTNTFTVDVTAPSAPVVLTPANGSRTNNTTPTYSGTAEAGSTVTVYVDGTAVGTTTANASGAWSFTQPTVLPEGSHTVSATAMDAAGNTSGSSNTNTFTVDLTPPAAPVVVAPANGSRTNDTTPAYSGTAEPGSTVTVIVDGSTVGTTTADSSGNWSFTPTAPLAEGSHTVKATATDVAGNTGPSSNTNSFIVDTTLPAAPVVLTPANGSHTNDTTPAYSGTAEAGTTVKVYVDNVAVGTTTADASGDWTFTQPTPLAEGAHSVSATGTDAAGNTSGSSNTNTFNVDVTAPSAPVVSTPANGSHTNDTTPAYSGTAEAGSTVTVIVDGVTVGTSTADSSGNWSFTPTTPLADGSHTVSATATDAAGNTSPSSATNTFTVDTSLPSAPVVLTPADGSRTNDTTPAYTGTAEAGSTVTVIVDGSAVGTTTAAANGSWSLTPATPLTEGSHTVSATATDAAGNTSPSSATNTFTVDLTPPAAPVVSTPANGAIISDNTPTYTGTAEAGSTVTVIVDGTAVGTTMADSSGNWSFTPITGLSNGSHTVKATATDVAGNTSPESNTNTFTVDATVPTTPVITGPADNTVTSDNTPTFTGTADPNTTVTVILNGNPVGTATVDTTGHWTFTPATPLPDGPYTLTATSTSAAGNVSPASSPVHFTVDTAVPDTSIVSGPSGDTDSPSATFDFSSTESGVTYECSLDGAAFTACSDPFSLEGLADGEHTLEVRARDSAGNVDPTPATATWNVKTASSGSDINFRGGGVGCASTGAGPSALGMMGLAVLAALMARKRRQ
ncbi:MAG: adventurous gliding motility protein AgmC [Hyalangium sp.]|uniref:adventurous gliding motility protein AgmC n=1 Tax=Hyalangium sp. TaxID=2028555 RepID=UPI00389A852A